MGITAFLFMLLQNRLLNMQSTSVLSFSKVMFDQQRMLFIGGDFSYDRVVFSQA